MVSPGPEPAALPAETVLLISGDEYPLNIFLQGVEETLPAWVYGQCSLMASARQVSFCVFKMELHFFTEHLEICCKLLFCISILY